MNQSQYRHTNSRNVTYYLNSKDIVLRGGQQRTIYFFSKEADLDTACDLPQGKVVSENKRNGFLVLKNASA